MKAPGQGRIPRVTRAEDEIRERMEQRYRQPWEQLHRTIERRVIGSDWGANGYTTLRQANRLLEELDLSAGQTLLDLGAGRGWPGLYFASRTGCRVIAMDLPADALEHGRRRAADEGLEGMFSAVIGSAAEIPLRARSVDAVVAGDVFC